MRSKVLQLVPNLTAARWLQRCAVTTWSPLSIAFNSKPERKINFSLRMENVGLFKIPQLTDETGFYLLQENAQREVEALVAEATSGNRKRKLVQVFDQLSDVLCRVADMADFVRVAHPSKGYTQAAEEACMSISALVEQLNTNVDIHRALRDVIENGDVVPTDEVDERVAKLFMFDFEQSGIHLEQKKREQFVKLNEKILMLSSLFMQGTQQPISMPRSKLPEQLQYVFTVDGDNLMVTGLFSDHTSDLVREAAYRVYLYPDPDQLSLLGSLLSSRHELAQLVGFQTYGHRTLRGTLAQNPENVVNFLTTLAEQIRPLADQDFKEILTLKKSQVPGAKVVMPWDPPYYSGVARQQRCQMNSADVMPYFSLGCCMDGLSYLFSHLYGVRLVHCKPDYGEVWSHEVHKLAVEHETEGVLGYIYCDFFERSGKPHQDCHFMIQGGREKEDGSYQLPVVVLMLNISPPRGGVPTLLTPGMVENLFHEFGHAMHSMLGRTKFQHVTGTRCSTDFAEVPSVLMEYFASDYRVLSKFAKHYVTGEPIPPELVHKLSVARKLFSASETQQQVFYAMLDQVYHGSHPLESSTTDILAQVQSKYYSLPYVEGTAWQMRFGHFVGYGAKYYSYLYSRAVASRIWHKCFKDDPFNREMGEHYRFKMLAHGGGKHPADLIHSILGEEPTTERLVQAVMDDITLPDYR